MGLMLGRECARQPVCAEVFTAAAAAGHRRVRAGFWVRSHWSWPLTDAEVGGPQGAPWLLRCTASPGW